MKTIEIKKGEQYQTLAGYIVPVHNGADGKSCYCDVCIIDEAGEVEESERLLLTLSDIDSMLREVDGQAHKVILNKESFLEV